MNLAGLQKFYVTSSRRVSWNGADVSNFGNEWRTHKMILENLVVPKKQESAKKSKAQLWSYVKGQGCQPKVLPITTAGTIAATK